MGRRGGPRGAKAAGRPSTKASTKPDHSDVSASSEDEKSIPKDAAELEAKTVKKAEDEDSGDNDNDVESDEGDEKENSEPEENSEAEKDHSGSEEEMDEAAPPNPTIEKPKQISFDCSMCFFTTAEDDAFIKHMEDLHRRDMGYWCKACGKAYEIASQLLEHIREFCDRVKHYQHACGFSDCDFKSSDPANLIFHFRNEHKGKYLFPCGQCEQQFTILTSLVLHQQDKCTNKDMCTNQGESSAARPKSKAAKNKNGTAEQQFRCSLCTFETAQKLMFIDHHADLHARDLCCCKRCGKVHKNAETLAEHVSQFNCAPNSYDHPCGTDECEFESHDPLAFRNHIRNGHPRTSLQKCQGCKKQFTIIGLLIMHMQEECPELNTEGRPVDNHASNGTVEDTIESIKILEPARGAAVARRGRGSGSARGRGRGRGASTAPASKGAKRGRAVRDTTPGSSDESEVDDPLPVVPTRSSKRVSKKVVYAHSDSEDED